MFITIVINNLESECLGFRAYCSNVMREQDSGSLTMFITIVIKREMWSIMGIGVPTKPI